MSVAYENQNYELVTDGVEITYLPAIETKEELLNTAEAFKQIFLYTPIKVKDRFLSVNEINFDTDKAALLVDFELEFLQEVIVDTTELPKAEYIFESVVKGGHGTSENTN